jgi:hypothetical protein
MRLSGGWFRREALMNLLRHSLDAQNATTHGAIMDRRTDQLIFIG